MLLGELIPSVVSLQIHQRPVVQAGALEIAIFERESERAYQMKPRFDCGGEPRDRAGVLRNLGTHEDDVQIRLVQLHQAFDAGAPPSGYR